MAKRPRAESAKATTKKLLSEGENGRLDYKRAPEGISADDLVSFANTETGGTILVGVDEVKGKGGIQSGLVVGCDVSDGSILKITNKALACLPPVAIEVGIEEIDGKPFLRVDIPSSQSRPHCSPGGVYLRRDGSRNRPLQPPELLQIFLETEARSFASRFEAAADRITEDLKDLESSLDSSIKNMSDQLGWADFQLDDTESTLSAIQDTLGRMSKETTSTDTRLRAIFRQDKRDDPVRDREYRNYVSRLVEQIREDDDLLEHVAKGGQITGEPGGRAKLELTAEEAEAALRAAESYVYEQEQLKRYTVDVQPPKKCDANELDRFAKVVEQGGEVAEGLRDRVETAFRLGFVKFDELIVGTAALKKPAQGYRAGVFDKAESQRAAKDYPYELGWIFLEVDHRKKGQMTRLIKELMPHSKGNALFSTTRTSNEVMQEMLTHLKFARDGKEYSSVQNPDDTIQLWVRDAVQVEAEEE